MRIYKNEAYIANRAAWGKRLFWLALGILLAGMISTFSLQQYPLLPLLALLLGFILAQVGTYYLNRFVRPDRPDVSLTAALKGFSDNFAVYHYLAPAAHILLAPEGCYVFTVKLQDGKIVIRNGRGFEPLTLGRILTFFGRESVGDVSREARAEANALARHIAKHLPDTQVEITPVVVFAHPKAQLEVESSDVAVLHAKQLKDWLRGPGRVKGLAAQARAQLVALLGGQEQDAE